MINAGISAGIFDPGAVCDSSNAIYDAGQSANFNGCTIKIITSQNEIGGTFSELFHGDPETTPKLDEVIFIDEIPDDMVFLIGGHAPPHIITNCNLYSLRMEADMTDELAEKIYTGEDGKILEGILSIQTQEKAQKALVAVNNAIIAKDKVRAHLGALQNRLENTVTNLTIQSENLQAAESRISDSDIALEMTNFIRHQVLTQSAIAMLGQANSYPHMLMQLIK